MVSITAARKCSASWRSVMSVTMTPTPSTLSVDPNRVVARKPVSKVGLTMRLTLDLNVRRRLAGFQHATVHVLHLGPHVWDHFGDGAADVLMRRSSVDFGERLVDSHDAAIAIDKGKADRRGRLQCFHECQRLGCALLRLGKGRHVLDGTDETARTALALLRHSWKGAQDVEGAVGPDRAIDRGGRLPSSLANSTSRATRSRSSGCTRPSTYSGVGLTEPGSTPRRRNMLSDQTRTSLSRSHSQVPVCASCSARSRAVRSGRPRDASRLPGKGPAPALQRSRR